MDLCCDRKLVTGYLRLSDNLAMMIRVCILPQEVNSIQTRSKKNTTAWFVDRHMQELLVLVYEELSGRTKPATTDKSQVPVFKRGSNFRATLYFNRHGYIQHLVIPKEHIKSVTNTCPQGRTTQAETGHSFKLHPEAAYAVVDDLPVPSNGGIAKLLSEKGGTKDITAYFASSASREEDKENILPMLTVDGCCGQQHRKPSKAKKLTVHSKLGKATASAAGGNTDGTKGQPEASVTSHQLKIDTLLNKKDTNIHVIKPHPTTAEADDNIKTDVLSSNIAGSPDASNNCRCCHEHATDTNDDILDCLFDDIDYNDLFDSELLLLEKQDRHDNILTPRQQQHEGSCDHSDMSCDATGNDNTLTEISADDDDDDVTDVTDVSTVSCSSTISFDDVVVINKYGKNHELSRKTIFRNTSTIKELSNKQIGRWMVFRKYFIRDIMAGKVPCERHNKYKEGSNARRVIRNESFLITAFTRDQLDYIIDHLKKLFELDGLLNYDYVMSVLLIEVCIHIIMDLHQIDYHTVPCERHNKYKEGSNARRVIRNESFLITAFTRDQLDYIIDHLRKLFELDGLLNYDYVMSVLLIEVCIHIIMDLHQIDYHTAEKTLMMS